MTWKIIFLSLRFYVKSIFQKIELLKLPRLQFLGLWSAKNIKNENSGPLKGVSLFCDMSDIAIWSDMDHFSSNYEIFTLRYGNLYFAIWESLLCDMILHEPKNEIFTLRYEKIYFAIWDTNDKTSKNVFCDMGHISNIEHSISNTLKYHG